MSVLVSSRVHQRSLLPCNISLYATILAVKELKSCLEKRAEILYVLISFSRHGLFVTSEATFRKYCQVPVDIWVKIFFAKVANALSYRRRRTCIHWAVVVHYKSS